MIGEEQVSLFDSFDGEHFDDNGSAVKRVYAPPISVVKATFQETTKTNWRELFSGYDELYAITFSSGVDFLANVLDEFRYAEVIFGCEGVMNSDLSIIMALQIECIQQFVKNKNAQALAKRMEENTLKLYVSRDTRSHEKIFILKSKDGRVRVICGSANMSASAFCGFQRENIVCFDGEDAYAHYKDLFDGFQEVCSDRITHKAVLGTMQSPEYLQENIEEIPIAKTVKKEKAIILEPISEQDASDPTPEIITNVTELAKGFKPFIPKPKKKSGSVMLSADTIKSIGKKYARSRAEEASRKKEAPKLHLDIENETLEFNGTPISLTPDIADVRSDVQCLVGYLDSFRQFHGDTQQALEDYFAFVSWFFATPFIPYLRLIAEKNNHMLHLFPVYGLLFGKSNAGKTTFIQFLSTLMCGTKLDVIYGKDITPKRLEGLKHVFEGVPLVVDEFSRDKYTKLSSELIKVDEWGLKNENIHYPAVVLISNEIPSVSDAIAKRVVQCRTSIKIDQIAGNAMGHRVKEHISGASVAFYGEYVHRMFGEVAEMVTGMCSGGFDYLPDIFTASSRVIISILKDTIGEVPSYARILSAKDYFAETAKGREAIERINRAWENTPTRFDVDKKANKLVYRYPEGGSLQELVHLEQELPIMLDATKVGSTLVMKLNVATEIFGHGFKKRGFFQL